MKESTFITGHRDVVPQKTAWHNPLPILQSDFEKNGPVNLFLDLLCPSPLYSHFYQNCSPLNQPKQNNNLSYATHFWSCLRKDLQINGTAKGSNGIRAFTVPWCDLRYKIKKDFFFFKKKVLSAKFALPWLKQEGHAASNSLWHKSLYKELTAMEGRAELFTYRFPFWLDFVAECTIHTNVAGVKRNKRS